MNDQQPVVKQGWGWGVLIPIAAIVVIGIWLPVGPQGIKAGVRMALSWTAIGILMFVILALIGNAVNKGPFGVLIDNRNMMSLSRLQIILWTVVILSAFVSTMLARVSDSRIHPEDYQCKTITNEEGVEVSEPGCAEPLDIQVPAMLWTLMGISLASAVGSPLLKNFKAQRTADEDRQRKKMAERTSMTLGGEEVPPVTFDNRLDQVATSMGVEEKPQNEGAVVKKANWLEARFSDIFMGEEVANFMYVDIAKVQNFLFSVFAVVSYAVAVGIAMAGAASIAEFIALPEMPEGLVAVIGISHGGYLTDKAFTHTTPTEPAPQQ